MSRDGPATVRGYRPEDLEACRALWGSLTDWHRELYASPSIGGPDPGRQFDEHLEKVGAERIWVAVVDGAVIGMIGLIPGEVEAELEPIVVLPEHRDSGIGHQLARTVIDAARASGVRYLKVRPVARNARAIAFFHEMGFGVLGHLDLFMDFKAKGADDWREGERIAGIGFRV